MAISNPPEADRLLVLAYRQAGATTHSHISGQDS